MTRRANPPVAAGKAVETDAETRREMLGRIIEAQEAERARVARDLHDDIGQALTSVMLETEASVLRVTVEDDGRGFAVVEQHSRLGLVGMQERAELVDGSVEITSAPGSGTRIELDIPFG